MSQWEAKQQPLLAFSLWLSAVNGCCRDVQYLVPCLVQAWMYLNPVIHSTVVIPKRLVGCWR